MSHNILKKMSVFSHLLIPITSCNVFFYVTQFSEMLNFFHPAQRTCSVHVIRRQCHMTVARTTSTQEKSTRQQTILASHTRKRDTNFDHIIVFIVLVKMFDLMRVYKIAC